MRMLYVGGLESTRDLSPIFGIGRYWQIHSLVRSIGDGVHFFPFPLPERARNDRVQTKDTRRLQRPPRRRLSSFLAHNTWYGANRYERYVAQRWHNKISARLRDAANG